MMKLHLHASMYLPGSAVKACKLSCTRVCVSALQFFYAVPVAGAFDIDGQLQLGKGLAWLMAEISGVGLG